MRVARQVVCVTYNKWYDSTSYASKVTNTSREQIIKCCNGKIPHTSNETKTKLVWMYLEDFIEKYGEDAFWNLHRTTQDFYTNNYLEEE